MIALQRIDYRVDGQGFTGWLADGSRGGKAAGILVAHEGAGLTGHVKQRAQSLAALGHVAFALDLFGLPDFDLDRAKEVVRALRADIPAFRRRVVTALDLLCGHANVDPDRLAGIGFCFGGTAMIELARSGAPLAAVVGFHAGLTSGTIADNRAIRAPMLICLGDADPVVTVAQRETFAREMSEAGRDWQIQLYGGVGHSFTNREIDAWQLPGFAYDAVADRRSWRAMLDLFDECGLGKEQE